MITALVQITSLALLSLDLAVRHEALDAVAWREMNEGLIRVGELSDHEHALLKAAMISSQCSAVYELSEGQVFSSELEVQAASQSFLAYSIVFASDIRDGSLGRFMPSFKVAEKVRILRSFSDDENALEALSDRFKKCSMVLAANKKVLNEGALEKVLKGGK